MISPLILLFGLTAFAFAVLVVVLRHPMRAALALIAHMISLAAIFACLGVHIVALFQVLIYVGAVMVLMIYTIMLLDDRDTSYVHRFSRWSLPAVVAAVLLVAGLTFLFGSAPTASAAATGNGPFGFFEFSRAFMTRYWFHFEVATVLLAVGIVSAWTIVSHRR
jgi:NADH-quinone oxidoreductase subunit J